MRWALLAAIPVVAAFVILGCGTSGENGGEGGEGGEKVKVEGSSNDDPCEEPYEFAYFQFARKGEFIKADQKPKTIYTLLYTSGWMKTRTFGGPFETLVKRNGIQTFWKEIRKRATHDLYVYFYDKGYFDLPGSDQVDWTRFNQKGYTTKALSVQRDDVRHIVFLDDVTGERGDDPRWGTFNDCLTQLLTTYSTIEDIRAQVQKGEFGEALDAYLKGK
ncbi:MAG: hypothetical protein K8T20_19315 [Planctomycetes bacterium]|nr:hypothetical protein [Planctomycetota bacterium]